MDLARDLHDEIKECERRVRSLGASLKINREYVTASDADPSDIEYFRCQIELEAMEEEFLARRLVVLRRWAAMKSGLALGSA
jgi:DNA-binding transcriptional MerR regulator